MIFTGYAFEKEDRGWLKANAVQARMLSVGDLPKIVDPRLAKAYKEDGWLQVEDQSNQGACAGHALTETGELAFLVATGSVTQLSRQMAYIGAQIEDGINGDNGSTIVGCTKRAKKGVCSEKIGPYSRSYPGRSYITGAMEADAKNYVLRSHVDINSAAEAKQFLGSGIGGIQIGIKWWDYLQNPPGGKITRFAPPSRGFGGHSVAILGYNTHTDQGELSPEDYWLLLKNSHTIRYADRGWSYVLPSAFDEMCRDKSFTVMVGRSDMATPSARKVHDFLQGRVIQI